MRSNILSKLISASCVWYSERAYYGFGVIIEGMGRRLPLQLQCSYQGQQGDASQSMRGNYKTRFWEGQKQAGGVECGTDGAGRVGQLIMCVETIHPFRW